MDTCTDAAPALESWRVITEAGPGMPPTSEATVPVSAGGRRVVVNGEGARVTDALEAGLATALSRLGRLGVPVDADARSGLRDQVGLAAPDPAEDQAVRLEVRAVHRDAMLTRLAALVTPHDVDGFTYRLGVDGLARVTLDVRGGPWQADRVAAKLRRVVGVLEVWRAEQERSARL